MNPKKVHRAFLIGIFFKALNGFFEILAGLGFLISSPESLHRFALFFVHEELYEDPSDYLANWLLQMSTASTNQELNYLGFFLLIHGLIKAFIIILLLKRILWAYPLSILVFSIFAVYQLVHFSMSGGILDPILISIDLIVIILSYLEYRALKSQQTP